MNWLSHRIVVQNNSGERIPPYALMELSYTDSIAVIRPTSETSVFKVVKPTSAGASDPSRIVVNGGAWIEADAPTNFGEASLAPFGLVLTNSAIPLFVGDSIGAVPGQWYAVAGGNGWHAVSGDFAAAPAFALDALTKSVFAYRYNGLRVRRHWIGYLYESYRGVVAGMWVVPSLPLDGTLPPFSRVYVYNIYKWDFGKIGATIRVEEDKVNNRWIGLMQEYVCPTSETIDPPTPPPEDDSTESGVE